MRLITIEFVEDTFRTELDESGEEVQVPVRTKGERLSVDPVSAKSFCDKKNVAVRVGTTTDDDKSAQQAPLVTGDVDTPPSEAAPVEVNDATGAAPVEPATGSKARRGATS